MIMSELLVSVIIPCRNEEQFIENCLDTILAQDLPINDFEILIVDGQSNDQTRDLIQKYANNQTNIKVLNNPHKIVPTALNIGIRASRGKFIMRMDAHNRYEKDYISKCLKYSNEYGADNVGGICLTLPGKNSTMGKSIALGSSHPFGVGNAYFRIGLKKPKEVDTVPFGCYKREVFKKVGLFDEDLIRNQDDEFNLRIIKNGGKVLLVPEIVSYYYARDTLKKLWKMYFQYGYFKPLVARKIGSVLTWRQLAPAIFISLLLSSGIFTLFARPFLLIFLFFLISYLVVNLGVSAAIALRKGKKLLLTLPLVFFTLHFSYGLGYLKGILHFILLKKDRNENMRDIPITR
ncbi:MAG TPA: glycosyltransferase family 2 protein [Thermodesulfobacteriota bacterium]|nr:glycosyltransferase family 2 protein [Thermodesulfobacteriota bacterium]